jgi:GT2 family glycosyltransferase
MDTMPPTLSIVIVSWNVCTLLERALASAYASWGSAPGLEVIVVDNASGDGTVAMIREKFPQVQLVSNAENRGFTRGNNQGIDRATGSLLFLLNPDTEVLGDALHTLVAYAEAHPEVGVIGPQLLNPDGSVQSSRRHFPTPAVLCFESTWLEALLPRHTLKHYYAQEKPDDVVQPVDWVVGAAMLIRREIVEQVGAFDEGFFMYSEELDWCRRIKSAGWEVVYDPHARIVHYEGKSSEQVVPARHIYFQSSKVRYARKFHGAFFAESLRLWLLCQYEVQLCLEGLKWLIGHKRALRASRIAAYRQVLRSGLRQQGPVEVKG